jgi:hypothetical protein
MICFVLLLFVFVFLSSMIREKQRETFVINTNDFTYSMIKHRYNQKKNYVKKNIGHLILEYF